MINVVALKEEHRRCYAIRIRNTVATALVCIAAGSLATYLTILELPLLGFVIGVVAILATMLLTMLVYVLYEPASHDLEEFAEIMDSEKYIQ